MSESRGGKFDDLASRVKDAMTDAEGNVDADGLLHRIRKAVGKAGSDVDADAIVARVKDVAGQAEGKVDAAKLKQWIGEVDRDKLKSWLDDAKTMGAGAASLVEAQGEKLADRAPGAFDKLAGAAKEKLGSLTGDQGLNAEGHIERFTGQIKDTIASVTDMADHDSKDAADAVKAKINEETRRG